MKRLARWWQAAGERRCPVCGRTFRRWQGVGEACSEPCATEMVRDLAW